MASMYRQPAWSLLLVLLLLVAPLVRGLVVPTTSWTYQGCYTEGTNTRAFTGSTYSNSTVTDEQCISFCSAAGYFFAGTEYANECYCANSFMGGSLLAAAQSDCNMACSGNANEPCGGPNRMTVFSRTPVIDPGVGAWQGVGCYNDSSARTLTYTATVLGGSSNMTVANCVTACGTQNYILAGVEYSGECFCGNAFQNAGGPAPDGIAQCNMACNGNSSEYCGGPNRLDVYSLRGSGLTISTAAATSNPVTTAAPAATVTSAKDGNTVLTNTATSTTPVAMPTGGGLPTGWTYRGCYIDNAHGPILTLRAPDASTMTVESCVANCIGSNYTVAGLEYGTQCSCGNAITEGGTLAPADTDCNMACGGNAKEMCGAGNRMSLYATGTVVSYGPPAVQTTGLPSTTNGGFQYMGCLNEAANGVRIFKYQIILANNNSATNCLTSCMNFGFMAGGMEYGRECYCGDALDVSNAGVTFAPNTSCSTSCTGNPQTICGAGNLLSYYQWVGTPLYKWSYPQGNAAGAYQLLIGGVVVPLITQANVNGKVTFTEKWGTGPANSTGAYELDISQINNFTAAWRPLHLKTDVFCSAGLTLPDKVGRIINVGGWSGQSTFGIRLYWPDGSPGVPGVHDWQENFNEVALLAGRWYPTAMIMANGSILVIGGESGSNASPTPSLEILPPTGGGTMFLEWLNRTDPYNLYPFLSVLPSGGIFVVYYNEARILDPKTFATIRQLPNLPGSVNNFLSGRTYPFEGTQVLMPQYAPYTTSLTVLVCGGSNAGASIAVDNCVSIQPENPAATWTLERMPSQRVMSCICALPDGTYLILNGAQQGVAGFGLASNPNLEAVLYDPTQPINSRMSVMANTTVARLYHSEAILLQDGRVMVSGSDPQDPIHPEEYRVEVFVPPYLLSGLAQPTYTITNKDWTYGASITITVSLKQGTTATMKVSLLGAVASTHGNSMGQRTIFPAVSCSGTTCTITAPPNANVCPPGWFQLFVLDGPTPSVSQWVRIGGDPAKLGNWPNFPDFSLPGM